MTHTKGPWYFVQYNDDPRITDINPENRNLDCWWRATIYTQDIVPLETHQANCALIAAAPELLEALEDVVQAPPEGWDLKDAIDLMNKCKNVIAKAKGETK